MSAEDALAIERLYARYNHAIHLGDGPAWADCFTPNGVFFNQRETVTGRQSLTAYANDFSKLRNARYWVNNLLLEPVDLEIRGSCYLLLLHVAAEAPPSSSSPASTATCWCLPWMVGDSPRATSPATCNHQPVTGCHLEGGRRG